MPSIQLQKRRQGEAAEQPKVFPAALKLLRLWTSALAVRQLFGPSTRNGWSNASNVVDGTDCSGAHSLSPNLNELGKQFLALLRNDRVLPLFALERVDNPKDP